MSNSDVEKAKAVSVSHLKGSFFFFFSVDFLGFLFFQRNFIDPQNEYLAGSGFRFLEVCQCIVIFDFLTPFSELQDSESIHLLN